MSQFPFEPFYDRVLVSELEGVREIEGVAIPDTTQEKGERFGIVMAVGKLAQEAQVGERISFGPYSGRAYVIDGKEFILMREAEISGRIKSS